MAQPLREFTRFIWWMQTQRRGGRQPSDQASRLASPPVRQKEVAAIVLTHHRHFIVTQRVNWYSLYRPTKGGRLSRPRHRSKGVRPVPKTVYRSGCRHNCLRRALNLGPLRPQSGMLPLGHCDTPTAVHCVPCPRSYLARSYHVNQYVLLLRTVCNVVHPEAICSPYLVSLLFLSFCYVPTDLAPFSYIYLPQKIPLLMIKYELSTSRRWCQQTGSAIAG